MLNFSYRLKVFGLIFFFTLCSLILGEIILRSRVHSKQSFVEVWNINPEDKKVHSLNMATSVGLLINMAIELAAPAREPIKLTKIPSLKHVAADIFERRSNSQKHVRLISSKQKWTSADYKYRFDQFGRRMHSEDSKSKFNHYLAIFGDSRIQGFGLNEADTLSYFLSQNMKGTEVLNYGVNGAGPSSMIVKLYRKGFENEIPLGSGIILYVWSMMHKCRVLGCMSHVRYFSDYPLVENNGDQGLVYYGTMRDKDPAINSVKKFISSLNIFNSFYERSYKFLSFSKEMKLACDLMQAAQVRVERILPNANFYVVPDRGEFTSKRFKACLERRGVGTVEFQKIMHNKKYELPDGHPNGVYNKKMAMALSDKLKNLLK